MFSEDRHAVCEIEYVDQARVQKAAAKIAGHHRITRLAEIFKVLSDPMRLKIILALQRTELCVCDLASLLGVTRPAVSHHLRFLRAVRLVKYRRAGKMAYYSLDDEHIERLIKVAAAHVAESRRVQARGRQPRVKAAKV
ncbi:MAG: metalloregulator ArsR/SmtB family transcription factor [candidate division KSB1 bacterium]|nr:metalloregulator ArsR/SmtB family transcription factor [candidate division KSB1 bacterium]MDZ7273566.1 metalloregulator ArsR/SmtB family transcription factor [candidate division KSB1 bacterium]MDZ7286843.1 metalloregulator ArsR/SmtB family transcription factor [candidate division KSB1 bacterium]MDZ7299800.1 metalloregulator ArsR/SmtB family transcription factor [candidate division KSB1 bacterium]MDZ7308649.1 metalloregulator ArsR/SmtB family transcription factor [candidate division KSB1 bact